ncbi:MAG: PorV/PorQ family protein [Bacteroidetes bacterium]|nr:PorV/PorQ family protein [Bacteroidota bacterium]
MFFHKKIFLWGALFFSSAAFAQVAKYSNEFLGIGVSARALAMGGANAVSSNNVTAGYFNPANLLSIQSKFQVGLMHAEYYAGISKYDYGALAARIDSNSVVAASVIRFGTDNIANTLNLIDPNGNVNYNQISTFAVTNFAALLSYARKMPKLKGVDLGFTAKIIRNKLGPFGGSWGFGFDVGASYSYKKWKFAAVGRDITGTFNAYTYTLTDDQKNVLAATGNQIPSSSTEITVPRLVLGVSRTFSFWKNRINVMPEINLVTTFDGKRNVAIKTNAFSIDPLFGLEVCYQRIVYIRAGLNNIQQVVDITGANHTVVSPSIGVGIRYKIIQIDYAFTNFGGGQNAVGTYSNVFSLSIDINHLKLPKLNTNASH